MPKNTVKICKFQCSTISLLAMLCAKVLLFLLAFATFQSISAEFSGGTLCDIYVLIQSTNKSSLLDSLTTLGRQTTAPLILGDKFHDRTILNSFCVDIISCLPMGSVAYNELMMAVRSQRSTHWKVLPCFDLKVQSVEKQVAQPGECTWFAVIDCVYGSFFLTELTFRMPKGCCRLLLFGPICDSWSESP